MIDPALKGTLNVLKSVAKNPLIKRVVLTSSMATVSFNKRPLSPEIVVDETWFSDLDFNKETKVFIMYIKSHSVDSTLRFRILISTNSFLL